VRRLRVATLAQGLSAIAYEHLRHGHADPLAAPALAQTWAGIRRKHGAAPNQKAPATTVGVRAMVEALPSGPPLRKLGHRSTIVAALLAGLLYSTIVEARPLKLQTTVESECFITAAHRLMVRTLLKNEVVQVSCKLADNTCEVLRMLKNRTVLNGFMMATQTRLSEIRGRTYVIDGGRDGTTYDVDLIRGAVTSYWTATDPNTKRNYTAHSPRRGSLRGSTRRELIVGRVGHRALIGLGFSGSTACPLVGRTDPGRGCTRCYLSVVLRKRGNLVRSAVERQILSPLSISIACEPVRLAVFDS